LENSFKDYAEIGKFLFYAGLFFLPSALPIAIIFLLISLIISFLDNQINYLEDRVNLSFYSAFLLIIVSSLFNFFNSNSINNLSNNTYLTFLGLLNWLPQIIIFTGFQKYLLTNLDRKKCVLVLLSGSIPVIFSCFSQSILNWHGPMKAFFGLIVWYQRPLDGISSITGLFSNPNYLGSWLNIIWPFCLALIIFDNKNIYKSIFKIFLATSVFTLIILTASRAALLALVLSLPFIYRIFDSKIRNWLFSVFAFIFFIFINLSFPIFGIQFQEFLRGIVSKGIWINFTSLGFESLDISRIKMWEYTLKLIGEQPLWGYGSRSFPALFEIQTGLWKGHSHNLPLELMVSYGIPATLFLLIPITYLVLKCYFKLFVINKRINKYTIIDQSWLVSLLLLILMQLVDIQYFDGKISITGWVLLAGVRNILLNKDIYKGKEEFSKNN
tara:strand:+ start:3642 stop:4964 length:1323 start_codon:yes stop_codon:yes gene_type:complete